MAFFGRFVGGRAAEGKERRKKRREAKKGKNWDTRSSSTRTKVRVCLCVCEREIERKVAAGFVGREPGGTDQLMGRSF